MSSTAAAAEGRAGSPMGETLALLGGAPALADMPVLDSRLSEQEIAWLAQSLASTPLTTFAGGFEVGALETEFAERFEAAHAVAVSSGSAALHASLVVGGVRAGDEVIVSPFSCVAPIAAIRHAGAIPVFADTGIGSLVLDPTTVESCVTRRTRAVLAVHLFGYPTDLVSLRLVAARNSLGLVGDCCMAYGSTVDGRPVGSIEDFGIYSLHATKSVSGGQGGIILTESSPAAEALREFICYGMDRCENVVRLGYNYVLAQPLGAIGRIRLRSLDQRLRHMATVGEILRNGIEGLPVSIPPDPPYGRRAWQSVPLLLPPDLERFRDRVFAALRAENVPVTIPYMHPAYDYPFLRHFAPAGGCPNAEAICRRYMVMFLDDSITAESAHRIVVAIHKVFRHLRSLSRLIPD